MLVEGILLDINLDKPFSSTLWKKPQAESH